MYLVISLHDIACLLAQAVHFCGRQGIALRGHRENIESEGNPGNFLALLKLLAAHNPILKRHIDSTDTKYKFMHHSNQNELIDIIGYKIIQNDILKEIKDAQFHSIMVDEASLFNKEIISLCFRFVDKDNNIREEFLDFIETERTDGKTLFNKVISWYANKGLDVKMGRGQAYDGASCMSSKNVGLGARMADINPKMPYMHCMSHRLNLSIGDACSLLTISTIIDKMKKLNNFFNKSPKKEILL